MYLCQTENNLCFDWSQGYIVMNTCMYIYFTFLLICEAGQIFLESKYKTGS